MSLNVTAALAIAALLNNVRLLFTAENKEEVEKIEADIKNGLDQLKTFHGDEAFNHPEVVQKVQDLINLVKNEGPTSKEEEELDEKKNPELPLNPADQELARLQDEERKQMELKKQQDDLNASSSSSSQSSMSSSSTQPPADKK